MEYLVRYDAKANNRMLVKTLSTNIQSRSRSVQRQHVLDEILIALYSKYFNKLYGLDFS